MRSAWISASSPPTLRKRPGQAETAADVDSADLSGVSGTPRCFITANATTACTTGIADGQGRCRGRSVWALWQAWGGCRGWAGLPAGAAGELVGEAVRLPEDRPAPAVSTAMRRLVCRRRAKDWADINCVPQPDVAVTQPF